MRSALTGRWAWNGKPDYIYCFGPDGKGAYLFFGAEKPFEYQDNGCSVTIYYPGELSPSCFRYTIDGNILSIEDSFGNVVSYLRCDVLTDGAL